MTREDLKNYKYSQEWVKSQLEKYQEQRTKVLNITQNIDGMPKAQNKENYGLEKLMDSYDEIIDILNNEQEKLNMIIKQMNYLEPLHKSILSKRYIEGKNLETISTEIGYSYNKTCSFNGHALDEFDKLDKLGNFG